MNRAGWGVVGVVVIVLGVGAARWHRADEPVTREEHPAPEAAAPLQWCAPGLEAIVGDGCFAAPAKGSPSPAPLVIYLHGRFERSATEAELDRQGRLARRASARGFAVLALRGREGQCLQPELATWVCWPASERTVDAGPDLVAGWAPALREAEARTGRGPRYLLGFSSGAFFTVIVATRVLLPVDAFAVAHGGPIEPVRADGKMAPMLLLSADDDPSQPGMMQLDDELAREKWPHDTWARAGAHELLDPDIDAALTFFTRVRTEPLPLRPPLSTHIPRARDPNARAEDAGHDPEPGGAPPPQEPDAGIQSP